MVTLWSVLFVLVFVGILGGTAGFVEWYVRATYFLAFDGSHVAIYEGRPGGFLWFKPHVVEVTSLTRAKVFAPYVPLLEHDMVETSYDRARAVAGRLGDANAFLALPTATATTAASPVTATSSPSSPTSSTPAAGSTPATTAPPSASTSGGAGTSGISAAGTSGIGAISASGTSGISANGTSGVAAGSGPANGRVGAAGAATATTGGAG